MNAVESMSVEELSVAWDWVLRLRDDAVTQEDLAEWLCWYETDDRHREAFEEMQAFWRGAEGVLEGPKAPTMAQLLGVRPTTSSSRRVPEFSRTTFLRWTPIFAGATAVVIGMMLWWAYPNAMNNTPNASAAPSVVRQTLPDGSHVELAAKSSVVVQYTRSERVLQMHGGEAYFAVARDRQRPFVVQVGDLKVQAIGTAFNVRNAGGRVVVAVTEGAVQVFSSFPAQEGLRIAAGQKATWDPTDSEAVVAPADVSRTLAWQHGRLEYLNEPLHAVIADVNRYSRRKITIRDETVSRIAFSGTVFTDATEVWVQALPRVFPVEIRTNGDGSLVLTSRMP
jgi:transmembrane sensor